MKQVHQWNHEDGRVSFGITPVGFQYAHPEFFNILAVADSNELALKLMRTLSKAYKKRRS